MHRRPRSSNIHARTVMQIKVAWFDDSLIIRSLSDARMMLLLLSVIPQQILLMLGWASLPSPASMSSRWPNAWKQHEPSCGHAYSGQETTQRNLSFKTMHSIVSRAFIMCMPVSDTDIILHLWNKWETLCKVMAFFFPPLMFSFCSHPRHPYLLWQGRFENTRR